TRDARAIVTSAILTEANPMPAVTAKTKVISQTAQPTNAVARWPAPQRWAAHEGAARATKSVATPMAKKSQPAGSVEPSERANHPLMTMPTPARPSAATTSTLDAIEPDGVTAGHVAAGRGCGTVGIETEAVSELAGTGEAAFSSADKKSSGIRWSEDGGATSVAENFLRRR